MRKTEILGMYAFTLYDVEKDLLVSARDPIGIIPLYRGVGANGSLWFASEMKAMVQHCPQLENFPPGHVFHSNTGLTTRFYSPDWLNLELPCKSQPSLSELRKSFMSAKSHMMADVPYAVLLSGGLDSIALLYLMHMSGFYVEAAHCNFNLRGEESDADAQFVKELCDALGLPVHVKNFDTEAHANDFGVSIQMAARNLRYAWFEELRSKNGLAYIATAHHREDQVETVLINLSEEQV